MWRAMSETHKEQYRKQANAHMDLYMQDLLKWEHK